MQNVQDEVKYMMMPELAPAGETGPVKFGAKDVQDLSWKNLLDSYSCTECGRCTAACPASITGKKLSPRKIMMDTRDRLEVVGKNVAANGSFIADGKKHSLMIISQQKNCAHAQVAMHVLQNAR